ncbi:hypothetical protein IJ182_01615 [bacterium]|nr:hypothetical protein [bacterium]
MGLDISGLKYQGMNNAFEARCSDYIRTSDQRVADNRKDADSLISRHNDQTNMRMERYHKLYKEGKMTDFQYNMAKLEANSKDLIYQIGINSIFK